MLVKRLVKTWRKTEAGLKGVKGNEEKETKSLLSSDKSEKAQTLFHYFLTNPLKKKSNHGMWSPSEVSFEKAVGSHFFFFSSWQQDEGRSVMCEWGSNGFLQLLVSFFLFLDAFWVSLSSPHDLWAFWTPEVTWPLWQKMEQVKEAGSQPGGHSVKTTLIFNY